MAFIMTGPQYRRRLAYLVDFGGKYIYQNNHDDHQYNRICSKQLDEMMHNFLIKMGAIFVSFTFALINPTYEFFAYGKKTTTTECHWPGVESKSDQEYLLNIALQLLIGLHAFTLYFVIEVALSLFTNVVVTLPLLMEENINVLIRAYKDKTATSIEVNHLIAKIAAQSVDIDR